MGYSPWGRKESDIIERLTISLLGLMQCLHKVYNPSVIKALSGPKGWLCRDAAQTHKRSVSDIYPQKH